MEVNTIIQSIMDTVDKKNVQSNCKKLLKKCNFKSTVDMGYLEDLATWLYVYGYYEEVIKIYNIIKEIQFDGNHTLWSKIDTILCIKARISREHGDITESKKIIKFVNQYRAPELYENIVDWFLNTLDLNIKNSIEQFHSKALERDWRLSKLICAICYREAGQFPVSDDKLESIIKEQVDFLSKLK